MSRLYMLVQSWRLKSRHISVNGAFDKRILVSANDDGGREASSFAPAQATMWIDVRDGIRNVESWEKMSLDRADVTNCLQMDMLGARECRQS